MNKIIIISVVVLVVIYVSAFVVAVLAQRSIVYPPFNKDNKDCARNIAKNAIKHGDTTLYVYDNNQSDAVVVFYHGNGHTVCDVAFLMDIFEEKNISYIFPEYTGYGGVGGKTTNKEVLKNAQDTVDYINEQDYKEVYVIGQSIGSGAASYHTTLQSPAKLLLVTPFTTLTDVVTNMFPMYPKKLISRFVDDEFNNVGRLKDYKGPVTIIHGTKDNVVPLEQSQELFRSLQSPNKQFITVPGYKHANITNSEELKQTIENFLD